MATIGLTYRKRGQRAHPPHPIAIRLDGSSMIPQMQSSSTPCLPPSLFGSVEAFILEGWMLRHSAATGS